MYKIHAHKIDNVPVGSDNAQNTQSDSSNRRLEKGGSRGDEPKLSLLQVDRLALRQTPLAGNNSEEWVRLPEAPAPQPGTWAVLLAGFLGICAVARPRIFSS
jgi:hypothetical protein